MSPISRRKFIPLVGTAIVGAAALSLSNKKKDAIIAPSPILPKRLKKGDTIGIAASAGPIRDRKEVQEFQEVLHRLGYKTKLGKNVFGQEGYFSAKDEDRANEFMELVQDEEVKGIFFIRGGWGCARILNLINYDIIAQNPKVIMGFSDITALLNAITLHSGLITFHGPGGNSTWNDYSVNYINCLLREGEKVVYQNKANDQAIKTYTSGKVAGAFYGGNLSVICGMMGSGYLPDWNGKILFLEDVGEEPYRIDRMLTQLKLAGVFNQISGLVLGNFRKCVPEEPHRSFTLEEVFEQHFTEIDIPVFYGAQIGHTRNKFTVPVGVKVRMDADAGTIEMLEVGVE
ncbi:MAG: LD-carboxypeptidase [Crocinitomicaceae bacterium]|nr:LD-carboxypeptidase [Crocinitomicaceae bacterium]